MQLQGTNGSKSHWQPGYAPHGNSGKEAQDGVTPLKPSVPSANKDGMLDIILNETAAETTEVTDINHQDGKMAILQYPLDDSLERKYCSDIFGELPSSNMQVVKESFVGQEPGCLQHMLVPNNTATKAAVNKAAHAKAAMTLGAGRAAGIIPQPGAEAFSKVRTLQAVDSNWQPDSLFPNPSEGFDVYSSASQAPPRTSPPASRPLPASLPPLKPQPRARMHNMQADSAKKLAPFHFSDFSTSAATMKNHQGVGMRSDTPSNMLCTQPLAEVNVEGSTSSWSAFGESSTAGRGQTGSQENIEIHLQGAENQQQNPGVDAEGLVHIPVTRKEVEAPVLGWDTMIWNTRLPVPIPVIRKEVETVLEGEAVLCKAKPTDQELLQMSNVAGNAVLESSDQGTLQGRQVPDEHELTISYLAGGYGNSAGRPKEASTSNKRKAVVTEEPEWQSENCNSKMAFHKGENQSADLNKPPEGHASTSKRTRAAEVHNHSERCRRDRINEKMKALQVLIPNCKKTDKASLLDEAIEYIKMLQLQLQMVSSMGKSIPPVRVPSGMQHLQIPALGMTDMSSLGMGMAMRMGMDQGMNRRDMAASNSWQAGILLPSPAGPLHNCYVPVTSLSMANVHNPRLDDPNAMDPLSGHLAHQQHQSLQIPQPFNMDMYNSYMLQHQQQQHHHHHHQHEQHHQHQSTNMGGGKPPQ